MNTQYSPGDWTKVTPQMGANRSTHSVHDAVATGGSEHCIPEAKQATGGNAELQAAGGLE